MDDEYQQQAADHGIEGGQGENGEDAPRSDPGAQGTRVERSPENRLLQDHGKDEEFLGEAVNENDQGDPAAERLEYFFQPEAAAEKKHIKQE